MLVWNLWFTITTLVLRLCAQSWLVIDHKSQVTMHYLLHTLLVCERSLFAGYSLYTTHYSYHTHYPYHTPTLQSSCVTKTFPVSTDTSLQHELYYLKFSSLWCFHNVCFQYVFICYNVAAKLKNHCEIKYQYFSIYFSVCVLCCYL